MPKFWLQHVQSDLWFALSALLKYHGEKATIESKLSGINFTLKILLGCVLHITLYQMTIFFFFLIKLKAFADKLNFAIMTISLADRVENTVGKGKNAGYQHFLLPHSVFQSLL